MGCPCEVMLYASSQEAARSAFAIAVGEVRRLDLKYSHYRNDSWLARYQDQAGASGGAEADAETAALFDYASTQFDVSGGAFDVTARPLTALWDAVTEVPRYEAIETVLGRVGWHRLSWDGRTMHLPAGMTLDFGGLVKEYAADRVAGLLRKAGVEHGYVDLGGDFHFIGAHPGGAPWQVGIRDPRRRERAIATVAVRTGGLASSGDYERHVELEGRRYSHLIDARTGWPIDTDAEDALSAVSVTAPSCLVAGSAATLAMLFQGKRARSFLAGSGLAWLAITPDGAVAGTLYTAPPCKTVPSARG